MWREIYDDLLKDYDHLLYKLEQMEMKEMEKKGYLDTQIDEIREMVKSYHDHLLAHESSFNHPYKSEELNGWKMFNPSDGFDAEANYLVCWKDCDEDYSQPQIAFWDEDEERFMLNCDTALIVDIYMEIPKP